MNYLETLHDLIYFYLFTNFINVDNLQILRYCKKLRNTIAYHIANSYQRTKYIIHIYTQTTTEE